MKEFFKKRSSLIKHSAICAVLVVLSFISFRQPSYALVEETKLKVTTYCCRNGEMKGACNDCTAGSGTCSDKICLPDEVEMCQENCLAD
jgi:hypothetical protein